MKKIFNNLLQRIQVWKDTFYEKIKHSPTLEKWIQKFWELYEKVRSSEIYIKIEAWYQNLGEREQKFAKWSVVAAVGIFVLFIIFSFIGHLNSYSDRIDRAKTVLKQVREVAETHQKSREAILTLKRVFRTNPDFKAAPFVETIASEVGIKKIDSFSEKSPVTKEYVRINKYNIKLSKIHLRNLVDFIYKVENSGVPLFVSGLQLKRLYSNIKYFNADMIIAHKEFSQGKK